MAKTIIEDLRDKGTRFFENLATAVSPMYTGRNFSGRIIDLTNHSLDIPIKNKRGVNTKSITSTFEFHGGNVKPNPSSGPNIIIDNDKSTKVPFTLKMKIDHPPKADTLCFVTFRFKNKVFKPGDPHYGWRTQPQYNGYKAGTHKISAGFSGMNDFPIIVENGATEVIFYGEMSEPVDGDIDHSHTPGVYVVEYEDTSMIYYDADAHAHVSIDIPAKSDYTLTGKKVSNIITLLSDTSANQDILDKLNGNVAKNIPANPEILAEYVLNSGGFDPKDPKNPIPLATRYYPVSESGLLAYDMLSRAYKSELHLRAKQGTPETLIAFTASKDTNIKINGLEYVVKGSTATPTVYTHFTINNALNDGKIVINFDRPMDITGINLMQTNFVFDGLVGNFPSLKMFANLDEVMPGQNAMVGDFGDGTIRDTLKYNPSEDKMNRWFTRLAAFSGILDLSKIVSSTFKNMDLCCSKARGIKAPKQIEALNISEFNTNWNGYDVPWTDSFSIEHLFDGLTKLKTFSVFRVCGISGKYPDPKDAPDFESYTVDQAANPPSNTRKFSAFMIPDFLHNKKLKYVKIATGSANYDEAGHKAWMKLHKPGVTFVPFEKWPEFKTGYTQLETIQFGTMMQDYTGSPTGKNYLFPSWAHLPALKNIYIIEVGGQLQGNLLGEMLPAGLEVLSFGTNSGTGARVDKSVATKCTKLTRFVLGNFNGLQCDPLIWTGHKKLSTFVYQASTLGAAFAIQGTLPDFSTMPSLIEVDFVHAFRLKGTLKAPPTGCSEFTISGVPIHYGKPNDGSPSVMAFDGGFPNMATNTFSKFVFGCSTIGHEGAGKNNLPDLTGSEASLKELKLFNMPNIKGNMPDISKFKKISFFLMKDMPTFDEPIPSIGNAMAGAHTIVISGNKNITTYAGTASSSDGNTLTKELRYQDNNLTAVAVETIIIAYSNGFSKGGTTLFLDNPKHVASGSTQTWFNKKPDLTKPAVKAAMSKITARGAQIVLPA